MASKSQKKPASKSAAVAKKPAASKSTAKKAAPSQKRPVRREVGGVVLLILTLCTIVSYFKVDALLINWLRSLIKGFFGYGYWVSAAAMLYGAVILLNHRGHPVRLRLTCTRLLPRVFGLLSHMAFCGTASDSADAIIKTLWQSGKTLSSGGVISGLLAIGSVKVLSRVASIIIFVVVFAALLMAAMNLTLSSLIDMYRERVRYE